MTMTRDERRQRVIRIGKLLHGDRFGKELAAGMGVSQQLVSFIVTDRRAVTDEFEKKLVDYLDRRQVEVMGELLTWAAASDELKNSRGQAVTVTTSSENPAGKTQPAHPRAQRRMVMPTLGKPKPPIEPAPEPELDDEPEMKP